MATQRKENIALVCILACFPVMIVAERLVTVFDFADYKVIPLEIGIVLVLFVATLTLLRN